MSHIDPSSTLTYCPHIPPNSISFTSAKPNVSLGMLFPLTGSHCPHGKVCVPDTELNSRYLYWELEFHEFFHLGDSPSQGPAGKPIFLKKRCMREKKIHDNSARRLLPHMHPWTAELNSSTLSCQEQKCPCFSQEATWSDRFMDLRRKKYILVQCMWHHLVP